MKVIDMTGQRYGRWTVLYRIAGGKNARWMCRCDCGTERIVEGVRLRQGESQSCGCLAKEKRLAGHHHEDLTGQRFGNLSVIGEAPRTPSNGIRWLCKCDCGEECVTNGNALRHGRKTHCGCQTIRGERRPKVKPEEMLGKTFGEWKVVDKDQRRQKPIRWMCQCSCGTIKSVEQRLLINGSSKHCGCKRREDHIGKKYGMLTVIAKGNGETDWICLCECGNTTEVKAYNLVNGHTRSCGCLRRNVNSQMRITHGRTNTRLHYIWQGMHQRCNNKETDHYQYYGGRGIKVCDEWKEFLAFEAWALENGYRDDLTIDRIDVNGDYSPSNCRWATLLEQANNKTTNRYITYNGVTLSVADWARKIGVSYRDLYDPIKKGGLANEIIEKLLVESKRAGG